MDASSLSMMVGATRNLSKTTDTVGLGKPTGKAADGSMFESLLNTAIDNIKATNSYLSDAENAEISFALGETDSTHDLMIALEKASTALQYTVAIRDKVMEAYKSLMQIQI